MFVFAINLFVVCVYIVEFAYNGFQGIQRIRLLYSNFEKELLCILCINKLIYFNLRKNVYIVLFFKIIYLFDDILEK